MEEPLDGNRPEPLWPLHAMEFLELLKNPDVRLSVDGSALKMNTPRLKSAVHAEQFRLDQLGEPTISLGRQLRKFLTLGTKCW